MVPVRLCQWFRQWFLVYPANHPKTLIFCVFLNCNNGPCNGPVIGPPNGPVNGPVACAGRWAAERDHPILNHAAEQISQPFPVDAEILRDRSLRNQQLADR